MRVGLVMAACAGLLISGVQAQDAAGVSTTAPLQPEEPSWAFDLSAYQYWVPDDEDYFQPTLTADRGPLHLEARYNYEDLATASAWVGYNLSAGDELSLELTPMLGVAFGDAEGFLLGYRGALDWWRLELSSESEYLFDTEERSDSFFYNWSELTVAPADWLWAGLAVQRTRAYESERDVQRGFVAGLTFERVGVAAYVFNPDRAEPIYVLSLDISF